MGTVLKREHGGRTIEVTVRATGFEYRHKVYSSLSQLAQQVTGTRWNGYHFFGLRKEWPGVSERERSIRCAIYTRKSTEEGAFAKRPLAFSVSPNSIVWTFCGSSARPSIALSNSSPLTFLVEATRTKNSRSTSSNGSVAKRRNESDRVGRSCDGTGQRCLRGDILNPRSSSCAFAGIFDMR